MKVQISGGEIQIDADSLPLISAYHWYVAKQKGKQKVYVAAHRLVKGKPSLVRLHRLVMGEPIEAQVGHRNHDGLDNRRQNLFVVGKAKEVQRHARKWQKPVSSKFKGVDLLKKKNLWRAKIVVDRKPIFLGEHRSETEAARAYDAAAKKHFRNPHLNFSEDAR
jgi:hypothetical protein